MEDSDQAGSTSNEFRAVAGKELGGQCVYVI